MSNILVGTNEGCLIFKGNGETDVELAGHSFNSLKADRADSCLAVVDGSQIWRRSACAEWQKIVEADVELQSIVSIFGDIYCGAMNKADLYRMRDNGPLERLMSFDRTPGRQEWFAGGPPLGVRSLGASIDGKSIIAGVHVGGIPCSFDSGLSWNPTIPVMFDVHEVSTHPTVPELVVAATTVGLCVSNDYGKNWRVIGKELDQTNSLSTALSSTYALFATCDGPFAMQSQVWRWSIGSDTVEPVGRGLPEWLDGKVDTGGISVNGDMAAILDGSGSLWVMETEAKGWQLRAKGVPYSLGIVLKS